MLFDVQKKQYYLLCWTDAQPKAFKYRETDLTKIQTVKYEKLVLALTNETIYF